MEIRRLRLAFFATLRFAGTVFTRRDALRVSRVLLMAVRGFCGLLRVLSRAASYVDGCRLNSDRPHRLVERRKPEGHRRHRRA